MKPSTLTEDSKILILVDAGWMPKAIKVELRLTNVWRVYDAVKRRKKDFPNFPKNRTGK